MRYTTRIIVPPRVRRSGPPGSPGGAYGPQVLGVRKTFGFGDRLGAATPGHLAIAAAHPNYAPVFAQQSVREMAFTQRPPAEVITSAARAVGAARFRTPWGADADRLPTAQDVQAAAEAGFTCFTFDPAEAVRPGVADLTPDELRAAIDAMVAEGDLPEHWMEPYLERVIDLPGNHQLRVELEPLQRAVVRYVPAILHCARLSSALARSAQGRPFEVGVVLDGAETPTTTLEHLFIGLELEARGVRLTTLSLTHGFGATGETESERQNRWQEHAAVADFCGPYKLGFDELTTPESSFALIGRVCGEGLHVKTAASSYLEALRVVARINPSLFREIVHAGLGQTAAEEGLRSALQNFPDEAERTLLDQSPGRELLDLALPTILAVEAGASGRPFKTVLLELLDEHADLYAELLATCFERKFALLNAG